MELNTREKGYYNRQIQLWGEERQARLKEKSIAVIGCGGLGCSLGIALGSAGVGTIHLVDFDTVSEHNIHRQIAFGMLDVDRYKSEVLQELIAQRNPFVKAHAYTEPFDLFSEKSVPVDLILDATDNLPSRAKLDAYAKKQGIPWLYASVEEWHGQICFFQNASFSENLQVNERKPGGITPPIVMQIAAFEANLALQYLAGMEVEMDALYYLSAKGSVDIKKFKMG